MRIKIEADPKLAKTVADLDESARRCLRFYGPCDQTRAANEKLAAAQAAHREANAKADEKIDEALRRTNGTADAFTITRPADVREIAERAERHLARFGIPKAQRAGARARYHPAGPSAKRYKYEARSTSILIERGSAAWYLVSVDRVGLYPKAGASFAVQITAEQAETVKAYALAHFDIQGEPQ